MSNIYAVSSRNACVGLALLFLILQISFSSATQFKVGGPKGWSVPDNPDAYNQWAQRMRFQIGDSFLFEYPQEKDSVLQVTKEDYVTCNNQTPIAAFNDGSTVYMFNQSGPFFFISGVQENCLQKEALIIVVMADRSNQCPGSNNAGSPPPTGSIEFVPSPPPPPSAAPAIVAGVISSMASLLLAALFSI